MKQTITAEIEINWPDGMSNESKAALLRKQAEELERKEEVHEPEQGDVYSRGDYEIDLLTDDGRNVFLKGIAHPGAAGGMRHNEFREHTYLGKFWDVFGLKSDHQKDLDELQAKYDDMVDKVVEALKMNRVARIRYILRSTGEPRILEALGGGE